MFTITDLVQPENLAEAYQILTDKRNNTILGGCAFLKMGKKQINKGIDLTKLNLNYIREQDGFIVIGAMTSLRELETHPLLKENYNGILPKSVRDIIGVQFRNGVTVGASIYSKYGFSDLITAMLCLDTEVELFKGGRMSLADFLARPLEKDLLVRLWIQKTVRQATYLSFRSSASDYAVLNVAVSKLDNHWTIVVGARPSKADIAFGASEMLEQEELTLERIEEAAQRASEELSFGTNTRGTAVYRKALCKTLVKRGIMEVAACKSN
ncbi:FAD binding domain-containing protein [Desulfosporosinus sp.]|uniref:FAD binding domain-containing protein n=1 Tax=Desulfosporosinus sp. TaxID=157907 RepID=UPI000E8E359C|nr:FAD binding domain-containing protein [Desulfosporosinus sp.]MBC2723159.1 FAD binding domain-containing protein [Desulfosporosinus sp.]MBC2724893.1 FAD binding domain-containing protein [Desulfosporosinus sp.]HBV87862.1 FAD-binding protein [Desulfosporosinus sp.]